MKASISAAVTSSGASTGCKAVDRTAGRLRQDWRVADDEPKQKGLHDGKPGCILAPGRRSWSSTRRRLLLRSFLFLIPVANGISCKTLNKKTKRENTLCSQAYRAPNVNGNVPP
ncbi:MAG: hypothetical protein GY913_25930 [Proteobacteria bacterium]|nr:hypothetical protein [Pseudomonadota bacterium]